jgi:D-alanine-D-alanine ligase
MIVAVVQGGPSAEAEVSRVSARAVQAALERKGHSVKVLGLSADLAVELRALQPDVVFPVAHGALGEDGCLQGMLEVMGLPYVGSGVLGSAAAADKRHAKVLYRSVGLPVAAELTVGPGENDAPGDWERFGGRVRAALGREIMVKPNNGGSAVGATRLLDTFSADDLGRAVQNARRVSDDVLLEAYHRGREVTCGVLETDKGTVALPPTWIRSEKSDWYDFDSKYSSGGSAHVCPAPFEPALRSAIERAALEAHRVLGARDMSRSDFIVGESDFIILETNTLPGMTSVSLFPEAAQVFGLPFEELLDGLVERARARRSRHPDLVPEFPA